MALEAIVFPQEHFLYNCRDLYSLGVGGEWGYNFGLGLGLGLEEEEEKRFLDDWNSSPSILQQQQHVVVKEQETNSSPDDHQHRTDDNPYFTGENFSPVKEVPSTTSTPRRKRRRTKNCKNKEEVENQRMTHIAVERNRRKQMNEYLAVLRSLMPTSYVQRGDQASIIGGAINFVKELEQLLQSLEAEKRIKHRSDVELTSPFADFFTFPQYSSCSAQSSTTNDKMAKNQSAIADIEVTMVESHANLKILSPKRPKQLLKMVAGFQTLRLTILHLNVTTVEDMVLYSFNVKVEEECQLSSVDEIATAVYQMLGRIQEEISLN